MATDTLTNPLEGKTLLASGHQKVGKITGVFNDVKTGLPEWVAVSTGMFGRHETLVPTRGSHLEGEDLEVPFDKDVVKDAPHHDPSDELTVDEERALFKHYHLDYEDAKAPVDAAVAPAPSPGPRRDEVARAETKHGADELILHEERATAGTEQTTTGRARLRKVVVTEQQTLTVPVRHEEVRVVREPLGPNEEVVDDRVFDDQEIGVTLHAERPVVTTETVATERVRLETSTVTEDAHVDATVRREQVSTQGVDTE